MCITSIGHIAQELLPGHEKISYTYAIPRIIFHQLNLTSMTQLM